MKKRIEAQAVKTQKATEQIEAMEKARASTRPPEVTEQPKAVRVLQEGLISPQKLAQSMDVPLSTIWRLAREGRLPFIPVGNQIRFSPSEVLEELRRQRNARLAKYNK